MKELIKITTNKRGSKVVSARELYEFLGFTANNWNRWYEKNIEQNPFAAENSDWSGFLLMRNGNETKDFALSIDFAKKIAMMSRTEKGEQIRDYFLECEKLAAQQVAMPALPQNFSEALRALANEVEERERLEAENKRLAPAAEYTHKVLVSETHLTTTAIAKELGMSAQELNKILCEKGVQYRNREHYVLTVKYQDKGYTKMNTFQYNDSNSKSKTNHHMVWTERGRAYIHKLINPDLSFGNIQAVSKQNP